MRMTILQLSRLISATCLLTLVLRSFGQKTVVITDAVRADVQRRLTAAASMTFSQRAPKQDKGFMKACNGQKSDISMPPVNACMYYGPQLIGEAPNPSLGMDSYMPLFKACAIDATKDNCSQLITYLLRDGKDDYAFALFAVGSFAPGIQTFTRPVLASGGDTLRLDGTQWAGNSTYVLSGSRDIALVLHNLCFADRFIAQRSGAVIGPSCGLAQRVGSGDITSEQVSQAVANVNSAEDARYDAQQRANEQAERNATAREQATSAILDALSQANQSNPRPMPYPSQMQVDTSASTTIGQTSQGKSTSAAPQPSSCRNMNSCLRTSGRYDGGLRTMFVDVTNTCSTTVRATVTVYAQNRSCTYSGTANIGPGQTQIGMGGYTDRNWYSTQADDSVNSGKTGAGCALVVSTDCN